jgi:putative transposase
MTRDTSGIVSRHNPATGVFLTGHQPTIVLLTVTCKERRPWLANPIAHTLLKEAWVEASFWLVGEYVLMPDHLHVFCSPGSPAMAMEPWIAYWKRLFGQKHCNPEWRFQSRGWHHRLRNAEEYAAKTHYMWENPVRRGLVESVDEWPYRGRIDVLAW